MSNPNYQPTWVVCLENLLQKAQDLQKAEDAIQVLKRLRAIRTTEATQIRSEVDSIRKDFWRDLVTLGNNAEEALEESLNH